MNNINDKLGIIGKFFGFDKVQTFQKVHHYDEIEVVFIIDKYAKQGDSKVSHLMYQIGTAITKSKFMKDHTKHYRDKIKELEEENSRLLEALTTGEEYISQKEDN